MSDTAEINAPARAANMLLIFLSLTRRVLLARLHGNYDERRVGGQAAAAHVVCIERLPLSSLSRVMTPVLYLVSSANAPFQSSGGGFSR
jgi:hypothetical protein